MSNYEIKYENDNYNIIINNMDKDLSDIIGNLDIKKIKKITITGVLKDKNDLLNKCINVEELIIIDCNNINDYWDYMNKMRSNAILNGKKFSCFFKSIKTDD